MTNSTSLAPAAIALPLLLSVSALGGQPAPLQNWTVRGDVRTTDGVGILGAAVWLVRGGDSTIAGTTDANGSYRFNLPLPDSSTLLVRRRGFADARVPLVPNGSKHTATLPAITLATAMTPLVSVVVPDTGAYSGRLAPFFRHVTARGGDFLTRVDIDRMSPSHTSTILRGMRGVLVRPGAGGGSYVQLTGRRCVAEVWIDGSSMGTRPFDVDLISPQSLAGVEVYSIASVLPPEYQTTDGMTCGAIGFWTRREDPAGAFDIASIADEANVRLAAQVDQPARLTEGSALAPAYPGEARVGGVGGPVLVELVVDSTGRVERSSVGVVSAPTPELAGAMLEAAARLRFHPATASGRPVRQLVTLLARYEASTKSRRR